MRHQMKAFSLILSFPLGKSGYVIISFLKVPKLAYRLDVVRRKIYKMQSLNFFSYLSDVQGRTAPLVLRPIHTLDTYLLSFVVIVLYHIHRVGSQFH